MAATSAADGSTWSSMTSTPTTRGRSPPAPAYLGKPTTTATATADTVPATSKETSGASAPAQFHSTGAGRPPGDAAHQIDPICMTQLMSAGGTLLARADIACRDDRGRYHRRQRSGRLARQVPDGSFPATLAWPSLAPSKGITSSATCRLEPPARWRPVTRFLPACRPRVTWANIGASMISRRRRTVRGDPPGRISFTSLFHPGTRRVYAADRPRNRPGCPGRGALARAGRNARAATAAAAVPAAATSEPADSPSTNACRAACAAGPWRAWGRCAATVSPATTDRRAAAAAAGGAPRLVSEPSTWGP